MNFISKTDPQFKANLHAHTTLSDGKLTPEQSVEAYKAKGYQILALTDHEAPCVHHGFTTDDFLMLTGMEINYNHENYRPRFDGQSYHFNLIFSYFYSVHKKASLLNLQKDTPKQKPQSFPHGLLYFSGCEESFVGFPSSFPLKPLGGSNMGPINFASQEKRVDPR